MTENENPLEPIAPGGNFRFSCSREVPCFNECCRDLNQFLFPYDILRLKSHLGMSSQSFLEQYTRQHTGPETGLPIITLKTEYAKGLACPFISSSGCRVYAARPSSCRAYPLVRVTSRSREDGRLTEQYMILRESHCRGFEFGEPQTVLEWEESQGLLPYNRMNDLLVEIIGLKNQTSREPLDLKSRRMFHLALYDVDGFREQVFNQGLLKDFEAGDLNRVREDDEALLRLGHRWIRHVLFAAER